MVTRYASCEFLERQEKRGTTLYDSYICELILFEIYSFFVKNEWRGGVPRCGVAVRVVGSRRDCRQGEANLEPQSILITHGRCAGSIVSQLGSNFSSPRRRQKKGTSKWSKETCKDNTRLNDGDRGRRLSAPMSLDRQWCITWLTSLNYLSEDWL